MKLAARALFFLLLVSFTAYGQVVVRSRVETVQFESRLVGKILPYSIVLPADYASPKRRTLSYPVLYLLHGLTGHYSDWLAKTKLREYAAQYRIIVVTPEGNDGWYTDSATVTTDKYETFILEELIPDVERRFRVLKTRQGRAIAGLSMGGYGALKFGVKHPDKFVFAAAMSGALDAATFDVNNPRSKWEALRVSILQTFGPLNSPTRAGNDLHKLVRNFPAERLIDLPFFYLDCGTEDPLLATNGELATILLERKIPHEFRQLPGKHNWEYWDQQVREVLKIANRTMSTVPVSTGRVIDRVKSPKIPPTGVGGFFKSGLQTTVTESVESHQRKLVDC